MILPPLPTPPTDNLYKFAAITGAVLFILAPVYWATFYITYKHQEITAVESLFGSVPTYDYYTVKAAELRGQKLTDEQKAMVQHYDAAKQAAQSPGIDYALMTQFYWIINITAVMFEISGLLLMYWGFSRWYRHVQEPLDRILQKQARDFVASKNEVENPS